MNIIDNHCPLKARKHTFYSLSQEQEQMGLTWKEEHLDFVLVPSGLIIMLGYHLLHLHRCLNRAETTVIGYENYNRRAWVSRILQVIINLYFLFLPFLYLYIYLYIAEINT